MSPARARSLEDTRRWQVLVMLCEGATYQQIGDALGIKEQTVWWHRRQLSQQYDIPGGRTTLVAHVLRAGIVDLRRDRSAAPALAEPPR